MIMASSTLQLLRLRLHVLAPSPAHAKRLVELLGSALDTPSAWRPEEGGGVVSLGGGATLEIRALPKLLAAARHQVLKRPPIARLCSVAIEAEEDDALLLGPAPPSAAASWQEWLEARPLVTPTLSVTEGWLRRRRQQGSSLSLLREVVLGASDVDGIVGALHGVAPSAGRPHVFWLHPGTLALRLLPSPMSALVLRAGDRSLVEVKAAMERRGVQAHPIGMTGASAGQLRLAASELTGLDIRICAAPEGMVSPVFPEGEEVLREHCLDELNPGLDENGELGINAGGASVPAAQYRSKPGGAMGDCWSEFRAQMKRPSGFMK